MAKNNNGLASVLKLLIILGIIVAAVVTCPDEKAHKQAVKETVRKECIREGLPLGGVIGSLATMTVTSTDFIVFSMGTIHDTDRGSRMVSVGLLGKVFVIPGALSDAV